MVGIFVDHDRVRVPQSIRDVSWSDAPIKIVQKEARRFTARKPELVPGSESASKMPMLPRTVQVETCVVRSGVVSDPFISRVDMRRLGVLRLIGEMTLRLRSTNLAAAHGTTPSRTTPPGIAQPPVSPGHPQPTACATSPES